MYANGSMLQRYCEVVSVDYQVELPAEDSVLQPSVQ